MLRPLAVRPVALGPQHFTHGQYAVTSIVTVCGPLDRSCSSSTGAAPDLASRAMLAITTSDASWAAGLLSAPGVAVVAAAGVCSTKRILTSPPTGLLTTLLATTPRSMPTTASRATIATTAAAGREMRRGRSDLLERVVLLLLAVLSVTICGMVIRARFASRRRNSVA